MKYLIILSSILLTILAVGGCATTETATQEDISADVYEIKLEGNLTTGYSWEYTMEPEGIIKEIDNQYNDESEEERIVGEGGEFVFTFQSVKPGETTLTFEYRRPWEEEEPLETKTFIATVDEELNLSIR